MVFGFATGLRFRKGLFLFVMDLRFRNGSSFSKAAARQGVFVFEMGLHFRRGPRFRDGSSFSLGGSSFS